MLTRFDGGTEERPGSGYEVGITRCIFSVVSERIS